ncbi:MAG: Phosphoglycerate mutase family [Tardiphaga sp.]|nr:Phosphoglycerate mutase family [Tardiphaga sp.]
MLIHLVRHGHHPLLGHVLCGRMPGVRLDELGCRQMTEIAELIGRSIPDAVQSSPQQRTLQSAAIIAAACGRAVEIVPAFDEIDMGRWTGARFGDLVADPNWKRWNERRGTARPPMGENMAEVQKRTVEHIEQLRDGAGGTVIVSHAEPIRAALMHYLEIPLDLFHTVAIDPASISTIALEDGARGVVWRLNGGVIA